MNYFAAALKDFLKKELKRIPLATIAIYSLLFLLAAFLALTAFVLIFSPSEFEAVLSRELQEDRNPLMDGYMKMVSLFGENETAVPMIAATAAAFAVFGYFKEGIFIILTSLASVINFGVKLLVNRQRPTDDLVAVLIEVRHQSFPSGHTVHYVVYFGLLMILVFRIRKLALWFRLLVAFFCLTLIFSVPFSRVYLGAHWTTDVTAGFIEGLLILSALLYFYFKKSHWMTRWNRRSYR